MTSPKVDYQDFADDTTDFIVKLKRVFADINLRMAAVENVKGMVDEFERRYGEVALNRIEAAIAPVLQSIVDGLAESQATLVELDEFYRVNGMDRVDGIIGPLIAAAEAALAAAASRVEELDQFLTLKQSIAAKGQPGGYAGLGEDGKVPSSQLPAAAASAAGLMSSTDKAKLDGIGTGADKTTASTVGASVAGVSQVPAPADGDRFAGVLSGASTLFWTTWGNIKAALKTHFDTLYAPVGRTISATGLATGGGTLAANRTITVPKADAATAAAGVDDTMAMTAAATIVTIDARKVLTAIVPTTSGAAIDMASIPPWAKKITMAFDGVMFSTGAQMLLQLGNGGIVSALNYAASKVSFGSSAFTPANPTTGFEVSPGSASVPYSGTVILTRQADFTWTELGILGRTDSVATNVMAISTGAKTLSSVLNRLRLTTTAGTATFTGGNIALLIE